MARPLRIEYPGAFYHVINRGQRQDPIVEDDRDRERFTSCLSRMCDQYAIRIHAYCLMTNHYHLILETPEANLSRAMQWLNVSYATYFNRRHQYAGHLFQGRYKAILIEADEYLESLSRYIHLNPVRAEMEEVPWDYAWSSCQYFVKSLKAPGWIDVDRVLLRFARTSRVARNRYKAYLVQSDIADPSKDMTGSCLLGSKAFVDWAKATFLVDQQNNRDIPELKRIKPCPSVETIVELVSDYFKVPSEDILKRGRKRNQARDITIYLSRQLSGCTGQELGRSFGGISGAAITMRCKSIAKTRLKNRRLRRDLDKLHERIVNN